MEPKLIDKNILKKLLKKGYKSNNKAFVLNKVFKNIVNIIKTNWYMIIIILLIVILLIHMYIQQQQKKQKEQNEQLDNIEKKKKKKKQHKKEQFKGSYESEYYKMLPKITNSPDIIPYQY
jgi:c-di-AMP phosphodiesterase-like protein